MLKEFKLSIFVSIAFLLLLSMAGTAKAEQITGNFTVSSHYTMMSNLNYSGWIIIENGGSLNLSSYEAQAKGIILENGSSLYVMKASGLFGLSYIYNNGTIYYHRNILNVTFLSNYGKIIHQSWLHFYNSLPMSYGGSGGGGGTNGDASATEGLNTRVSGGAAGDNPAGAGAEAPLLGDLSSPIFNESILSGASGGNSSCEAGSEGAYGLIINTSTFENFGSIFNQGGSAGTPCYSPEYNGGGGGAGGGGVLEIVFSSMYLNKGVYNLSGGSLNSYYFSDPDAFYKGWGGEGGAGQLVIVRVAHDPASGQNTTVANAASNASVSIPISALSYINKTLVDLTSEISGYQEAISGYQGEIYALNKSYHDVEATLSGVNDTLSGLVSKDSGYQAEISGLGTRYGEIQSSLSDIYDEESLIQNQTALIQAKAAGYNYTAGFSGLEASDKAILSGLASVEDQEYWIQSGPSSDYYRYTSNLSNGTIFLANISGHEDYSEAPYLHEDLAPVTVVSSPNYSLFGRQQPAADQPSILSEIYSGFVQVVTFIPDMVARDV